MNHTSFAAFVLLTCMPSMLFAQKWPALTSEKKVQLPVVPLDIKRSSIEVDANVPSGVPVVFWVSIPNTSGRPQQIRVGPGNYLPAEQFAIRFYRPRQSPLLLKPANGQTTESESTHLVMIPPKGNVRVPLAIDPLLPGDYEPSLLYSQNDSSPTLVTAFKLHVIANPEAKTAWIKQRMDEARGGDPFAACVCLRFQVGPVVHGLLDDLVSEDRAPALNAARVLAEYFPTSGLPAGASESIATALGRHVKDPPLADADKSVPTQLARLASKQPQREYLPSLLQLTESDEAGARSAAMTALETMDEPSVRQQFVKLLESKDADVRWMAANALLVCGDERALAALATIARDPNSKPTPTRPELELLALFPDQKIAADTIAWAQASSDPYMHAAVIHALNSGGWRVDPLGRRPPPTWMVSMTRQQAMQMLLTAPEFCVLSQATASDAPKLVIAFRLVETTTPGVVAGFHLLNQGTTAGKLYGLCLLQLHNLSVVANASASLKAQGGEVVLLDGVKKQTASVGQVIEKIMSGEFSDRLSRIYPQSAATSAPAGAVSPVNKVKR
jgi:hypothetical protein